MMNWLKAMQSLDIIQLRWVCAKLLGRSGISDELFVQMCMEYLEEEE